MRAARGDRVVLACTLALLVGSALGARANEPEWVDLLSKSDWGDWKKPTGDWRVAGDVRQDRAEPRRLASTPGQGIIVNGVTGRTTNLETVEKFGDLEAHFEFMVPTKSNSGVKLQGLYEIQIYDSWGVKEPKASDCGGIYPRAELLPNYHYLDKGYPPRTNACLAPGDWQTLDITFKAPRFDAGGKKVENARFVKVLLNGRVVQEDVELKSPTGHAWKTKEVAEGPLLLQADHGPVAFRNIRVRRMTP